MIEHLIVLLHVLALFNLYTTEASAIKEHQPILLPNHYVKDLQDQIEESNGSPQVTTYHSVGENKLDLTHTAHIVSDIIYNDPEIEDPYSGETLDTVLNHDTINGMETENDQSSLVGIVFRSSPGTIDLFLIRTYWILMAISGSALVFTLAFVFAKLFLI